MTLKIIWAWIYDKVDWLRWRWRKPGIIEAILWSTVGRRWVVVIEIRRWVIGTHAIELTKKFKIFKKKYPIWGWSFGNTGNNFETICTREGNLLGIITCLCCILRTLKTLDEDPGQRLNHGRGGGGAFNKSLPNNLLFWYTKKEQQEKKHTTYLFVVAIWKYFVTFYKFFATFPIRVVWRRRRRRKKSVQTLIDVFVYMCLLVIFYVRYIFFLFYLRALIMFENAPRHYNKAKYISQAT